MRPVISKNLKSYLTEIENQASRGITEGYFPVDVVIDAFSKGEESGAEKAIENFKNEFIRRSTQMFLYGNDLISDLEKKKYDVTGFYVNPIEFKFMITTPVENTYNENFISDFFEAAYRYEEKFREEFLTSMKLMFVKDSGLNADELMLDGFFNLKNGDS